MVSRHGQAGGREAALGVVERCCWESLGGAVVDSIRTSGTITHSARLARRHAARRAHRLLFHHLLTSSSSPLHHFHARSGVRRRLSTCPVSNCMFVLAASCTRGRRCVPSLLAETEVTTPQCCERTVTPFSVCNFVHSERTIM